MNEEYKTTGGIITSVILIFCGVIIAPVAIGILCSYPDAIWSVGLIMSGSSLLLIYSGIAGIIKTKKESEHSGSFLKDIQQAVEKKETPTPKKEYASVVVLAHWKYSAEEWDGFFNREKSSLGIESFGIGLGIVVLGTTLLVYSEGASLSLAFTLSGGLAVIFSFLKFILKKKSIAAKSGQPVEVIIGLDTVVINGKLNVLRDEKKWLGEVELKKENNPELLEFTYYWNTRNGLTNDEVRIPIPSGKIKEAEDIVLKLKLYHRLIKIE